MALTQIRHYQPVTGNIHSSGQPTAEQLPEIAAAGFKRVINLAMPGHPDALPDEAQSVTDLGMEYHAIPVPFDAPRRYHYQALFEILNRHPDDKIWVHCILNYRVSALLFHYLQAVTGVSATAADAAVFSDWQPDKNWQMLRAWPSTENNTLQIRDFQPADLPALLVVFQRAVYQGASADYSPAQLQAWAPDNPDIDCWLIRLGRQQVFICETGQQQIAGFIGIDQDGWIDLLFTDPVMQGWGVAKSLLRHAEHWARRQNITVLGTDASLTAKGFFQRQGFTVISQQQVRRGEMLLTNVRMQRAL